MKPSSSEALDDELAGLGETITQSIGGELLEETEIARLVGVLGTVRKGGPSIRAEAYETIRVRLFGVKGLGALTYEAKVLARHTVLDGEIVHRVEYDPPRSVRLTLAERSRVLGIGEEEEDAPRWEVLRA